jgi:hypothetical protein
MKFVQLNIPSSSKLTSARDQIEKVIETETSAIPVIRTTIKPNALKNLP